MVFNHDSYHDDHSRLTNQAYWSSYYQPKIYSKEHILSLGKKYDRFFDLIAQETAASNKKTVMEIGTYPARYLAYFASKYHFQAFGLDFNEDVATMNRTLATMGIDTGCIFREDFFSYNPSQKYDVVFSFGFIEHFKNYKEVMDRHLLYLAENGTLMIVVPNMRKFNYIYKRVMDKNNLLVHVIDCMKREVFQDFAERNNLQTLFLGYHGGFPFNVHGELGLVKKGVYQVIRQLSKRMLNSWLEQHPHSWLSSELIGVFKKK